MAQKWQKVYIFISSTFNDMHAERDYLVKKVFPQLSEWCERRRLHMVDIDLRWGVTEADAAHNKNVLNVCLKRIDDCRPFFVCFLGQRRGWVPKKNEISPETLKSFPELESYIGKTSVTEMEILHALIKPLHGDSPCDIERPVEYYEPAKHAFFYLRDKSYLSEIPSEPPLLRQTYTNELITDVSERKAADRELKEWREVKIPETARPVKIYKTKWNPEESTPEIAIPLQCPSDNHENIERWRNDWQRHAHVRITEKDVEENIAEAKKAKEFNEELIKGRLTDFEYEGEKLEVTILSDLKKAIETDPRFKDHKEVDIQDELQQEIDQQEQFVFINSKGFIKRKGDFEEIDKYVESDSNKLFVLTAEAGMGKSCLLANWVNNYRDKIENKSDHSIHFRFIGASDGANTVYSLLRLLLREIKEVSGKLEDELPDDPTKLRNALPEILEKISRKGKTVIVIDALNQLVTGLKDLTWLPRELPDNIKLIVSFKCDNKGEDSFYKSFDQNDRVQLTEINPFEAREDRKKLINAYLSQYLKELDERHIQSLIDTPATQNPLYLKVILSEIRVFGSFANLGDKIRSDFGDTPVSAFNGVLNRLENDPAYSPIVPKQAAPLIYGMLAHARNGLSADELTNLLIQALEMEDNAMNRENASDTVFLFLRQVRPFLARRDGRYDFFYESFKAATLNRYVTDKIVEKIESWSQELEGLETIKVDNVFRQSSQKWHGLLASYFSKKLNPNGDSPWSGAYPRGLSELPYHQTHGQMWAELSATLCDLLFVKVKCDSGMLFDLIRDYDRGIAIHPNNSLTQMQRAIKLALPSLLSRTTLAIQSIYNRLIWLTDLDPYLLSKLKIVREGLNERGYWISAEAPLPDTYTKSTLNIPYGIKSSIQALSLKDHAIAIGSFDGEVEINNLSTGGRLNKRHLNAAKIKAIALYDDLYSLAYMDINGLIYSDKTDRSIKSRKGETLLALNSNNGILTILPDNSLVEWFPENNKLNKLATALPQPLIVLKNCCDGQRVLFVAGFKNQVIGISKQTDNNWETKVVPYLGIPITDADLNAEGNRLILASMNRCLRVICPDTNKILAELSYERRGDIIIRGAPVKCAFGISDFNNFVYFATNAGHIASWNIETDRLSRLEDYTSINESHNLIHFNFIAQLDQLFISTEDHGKLITKQGNKELLPRHSAAITGCFITASDKVISTSTNDLTIRWYAAEGLSPLGQKSLSRSQEPTAIARHEDTDTVIVGSSQGLIWNQPCNAEVEGKDVYMALAEPVVSLFSENRECVLAAGKSGRVLRVNLLEDRVDVLCRSTGFQKQQKILYAGNAGLFWSVRRDETAGECFSVVSLVHSEKKENEVFKTRHLIKDVAISSDGATLCIVEKSVRIFRKRFRGWTEIYSRDVSTDHVSFLGNKDMVAVVLRDEPWLEVWKIDKRLPTIAAIYLPGKVSCLSTKENRIVAGFLSGALLSGRLNS